MKISVLLSPNLLGGFWYSESGRTCPSNLELRQLQLGPGSALQGEPCGLHAPLNLFSARLLAASVMNMYSERPGRTVDRLYIVQFFS